MMFGLGGLGVSEVIFFPRQQEMLEAGDIVKSSEAKLYPKFLGSIFGEKHIRQMSPSFT